MNIETFWAIVANAMVIGGAVGGGMLLLFCWVTWPASYREGHAADSEPERPGRST
jgi:hypothetical protein